MRQHTYIYMCIAINEAYQCMYYANTSICLLCGLTLVLLDGDEAVSSST